MNHFILRSAACAATCCFMLLQGCSRSADPGDDGTQTETGKTKQVQREELRTYLTESLLDDGKAAVLHGSPSGDIGIPTSLGIDSRKQLLDLLIAHLDSLSYSDTPFGSVTSEQFSMPFRQALVIGGARRGSSIVLVVALTDIEQTEYVIVQPVGSDSLTGHFRTTAKSILNWYSQSP